jgi:hypothetical protein
MSSTTRNFNVHNVLLISLFLVPHLLLLIDGVEAGTAKKNAGSACGYCKYMVETFKNVSVFGDYIILKDRNAAITCLIFTNTHTKITFI